MEIRVNGVNFKVGQSLTTHCEGKLEGLEKFSVKAVSAEVDFSKEGEQVSADVKILTAGLVIRANGINDDAYAAFETALEKAEKQLGRYKDRIKKHNRRRDGSVKFAEVPMTYSVIEEDSLEEAPEDIFAEYMPKVEHKDVKDVQTLTVDEAVMQMDLLHTNFFIFQNAKTEQLNVVYREQDGSNKIGWIEPKA